MSFKKKKKPLPDIGPSYDDGKLSFSGREEMDDLTENEQRMLTFSEMEPVELAQKAKFHSARDAQPSSG